MRELFHLDPRTYHILCYSDCYGRSAQFPPVIPEVRQIILADVGQEVIVKCQVELLLV